MITIILDNADNHEIERAGRVGNERFLVQSDARFLLLSEVDEVSYTVFAFSDMPVLVRELQMVRAELNAQDQIHLDEILRLTALCREPGMTLTFTPFC